MALLVALSLALGWGHMPANVGILRAGGIVACAAAVLLMLAVDVPMYLARWRHGRRSGIPYPSVIEGLQDALRRRRVAHHWSAWRPKVPWMTLYFTAVVWLSFCLVFSCREGGDPAAIARARGRAALPD